jgi:hypothetical protein
VQLFLDNWCPPSNAWFRDEVFDIQMHTCMVKHLGVQAESPRDEVDGVGAKFNTYSPVRSFKGPYDHWFENYKKAAKETIVNGRSCCARYPVAFHYVEAGEIVRVPPPPLPPPETHTRKPYAGIFGVTLWQVNRVCLCLCC